MHERENALKEWLAKTISSQKYSMTPLAGDASFRRYFRVRHEDHSYIVMDAPPGKEDLAPFIHIAEVLEQQHLRPPQIHAADLEQGFLLLSDFGDDLLLNHLNESSADHYYKMAIAELIQLQRCSLEDPLLPDFDQAFMIREMSLCYDWFLTGYLELELNAREREILEKTCTLIASTIKQQPLVLIHRDYHSRNLMLLHQSSQHLGIIDFQDAMRGPLTYDLVSLLKDCYITWPRSRILAWVNEFYQQSDLAQGHYSAAEFIRAFDWSGVQRHLKILGVFSRLYLRDDKPRYLADLPVTLNYVLESCALYPELHPLLEIFQERVQLP